MMRRWLAAPVVFCMVTAGCGGGGVDPITRSTLSNVVPPVSPLRLVDALPEPADFGGGWRLEPGSLGKQDYYASFSRQVLVHTCEGANPKKAGIPTDSKHTASVLMVGENDGSRDVSIIVAVDSPAASADRISFLRAAYEGCSEAHIEKDGEVHDEKYELLEVSGVKADQTLAVKVTDRTELPGEEPDTEVETAAYARVGGLVVALTGRHGTDPRPLLAAALAEARQELGL
ncbi:hypothetical protein E1264_27435 [Actinomadura sp. KC216]|uniref:hypothetical protein n=1 Tax=Actinomadura sp. KC216 TaxID=2530370 RepID=UPI00104A7E44|nr:hypothetical protein [Actinomadura sp. KC216]TDB83684.1 hypothetical protein E1264_27435 [Actinomadura sp. KC216]